MAARTVFHVAPRGAQWNVQQLAGTTTEKTALFPTRDQAIDEGHRLARANQPCELIVYDVDGTIVSQQSYDGDSSAPPDGGDS